MAQQSTHDFQGIMAQVAEAVRRRVRAGHLEPVVIVEADDRNGFTFTRAHRVVRLADDPQMPGRIGVYLDELEPLPIDPALEFDHEAVERGAEMILARLDDSSL
jgi:hypothetical protein